MQFLRLQSLRRESSPQFSHATQLGDHHHDGRGWAAGDGGGAMIKRFLGVEQ